MIETLNLIIFVEGVVQLIEFGGLHVVQGCIVSIDSMDFFGQSELFQHLLEGICHCNTCV
jgi:hypothetical protein